MFYKDREDVWVVNEREHRVVLLDHPDQLLRLKVHIQKSLDVALTFQLDPEKIPNGSI